MISSTETFTDFVDGAPPAAALNGTDKVAVKQGGVTKAMAGAGFMALQNSNNVDITGGSITGVVVTGSSVIATGGTTAETLADRFGQIKSILDYGAKCDYVTAGDGVIAGGGGLGTFTSASTTFSPADVGKYIKVVGAGAAGAILVTTISGVTSTHVVTLTTPASTAVSGAVWSYATDDTAAIADAIVALQIEAPYGAASALRIPGDCLTGSQTIAGQIAIIGNGRAQSRLFLKAKSATSLFKVQPAGSDWYALGFPPGQVTIRDMTLTSDGGALDPAGATTAHGVEVVAGTVYTAVELQNIGIYNMPADGLHAISTLGQMRTSNSFFWGNGQDGYSINSCSDTRSNTDNFGNNIRYGIVLSGADDSVFYLPDIFTSGSDGILIFGNAPRNQIIGGTINANAHSGILFSQFSAANFSISETHFGAGGGNGTAGSGFADITFDNAASTGSLSLVSPKFNQSYASGTYNIQHTNSAASIVQIDSVPYIAAGRIGAQFASVPAKVRGGTIPVTNTRGYTYDLSTATGAFSFTGFVDNGVAFTPTHASGYGGVAGGTIYTCLAASVDDALDQTSLNSFGASGFTTNTTDFFVLSDASGANNVVFHITGFSAGAVNGTMTKTGSPTGMATIVITAGAP